MPGSVVSSCAVARLRSSGPGSVGGCVAASVGAAVGFRQHRPIPHRFLQIRRRANFRAIFGRHQKEFLTVRFFPYPAIIVDIHAGAENNGQLVVTKFRHEGLIGVRANRQTGNPFQKAV